MCIDFRRPNKTLFNRFNVMRCKYCNIGYIVHIVLAQAGLQPYPNSASSVVTCAVVGIDT